MWVSMTVRCLARANAVEVCAFSTTLRGPLSVANQNSISVPDLVSRQLRVRTKPWSSGVDTRGWRELDSCDRNLSCSVISLAPGGSAPKTRWPSVRRSLKASRLQTLDQLVEAELMVIDERKELEI